MKDKNKLYSIGEVAHYLSVFPLTLKRAERRGEIKSSFRIGHRGDRRYTWKAVQDYLHFYDKK